MLQKQMVKIRMGNVMGREWNGIEWNRMVWEYNGIRVGIGLQQFSIKLKLKEYPGHWSSSPVAIALGKDKSTLKLPEQQHSQKSDFPIRILTTCL